jgi:ribosomal-protein-serine acetyltransferase
MPAPFRLRVDERLELRQRMPEDAEELFALTDANRARLRQWLPWLDHCTEPAHTRANIEGSLRQAEAGTGLALAFWYEGRIVGVGGYNYIDRANRIGHLGYWLGSTHEGRGIMSAGNRALVDHGFAQLGLVRQTIAAATGNTRSRAVAERLGFVLEGVLRDAERLYDRHVDHALYALTLRDWERLRAAREPAAAAGEITVRAMVPDDLPAALALWNRSEGVGMHADETPTMLAAYLARNPGLSAVALALGGELLGALLAGHDGRRGLLYHLAVEPAHRKHGLGRRLVAHSLAGLRTAGIVKASILVYAHNERGRAFWEKLGWQAREDLRLLQIAP